LDLNSAESLALRLIHAASEVSNLHDKLRRIVWVFSFNLDFLWAAFFESHFSPSAKHYFVSGVRHWDLFLPFNNLRQRGNDAKFLLNMIDLNSCFDDLYGA